MMVYIAADHRGYQIKEKIKEYLSGNGISVSDLGATNYDKTDDYTDFGINIGEKVVQEKALGVAICGGGAGICIAANKVNGARAALCTNTKQAKAARNDDNANILCLSADYTDESTNLEIVDTFINSVFSPEERFVRRINKITAYESQKCC